MTRNEDFLFAQEAIAQGFVSEAQVEEALLLQRRMADDLKLDERLGVILVKRGYLAEDQARRVYARIEPEKTGEIPGYRLLDVIGRGAMGTVYRALHLGLNRVVALKILRPDLRSDRTQVERLKAEAAMLASLDHPNVVRVLDAGESNGYPYFVMEYVEGETLRDRLRREGPLPEAEALRITRAIGDALERARRMGIVHRDVKPGNVLLARNGVPKLMDLGLAKGPIDLGLTQHGATVGTPQYISPEQAVDPRRADTRSDIYGLGATLYAMLTGEPPFDGQTLAEILTKVLYETPVPVRTRRPDVSREAGFLVERMMLKDPTLRYKVPAAVVADIDRIEQGASILPSGFTGSWEGWLLRARTRKVLLVGVAGLGVAAALAIGGHFALKAMRAERDRTTYEDRIDTLLRNNGLHERDDGVDVRHKATKAVTLLREVEDAGVEPDNREDLRRHVVDLDQERKHFDDLDAVRRKEVEPAKERGDWAAAEAALTEFTRKRPNSPSRRRAEERLAGLREESDQALRLARARQFGSLPPTLEAAEARVEDWSDRAQRFAPTPAALKEVDDARLAHQALEALGREAAGARAELEPASLQPRLDRLDFRGLHDDVERRARRAEVEAGLRKPALSPYLGEDAVLDLVRAPFTRARAELATAVERAFGSLVEKTDDLVAERRTPEAIDLLTKFAQASEAFPGVSGVAGQKAAALEQANAGQVAKAELAWDGLLRRVRAALRGGNADEVRRIAAEARADPAVYGPVHGRVEGIEPVADLLDELWDRVARALLARVGPDKRKWLDPVPLRNDTREHAWEVRAVDRAARRFTVVSHRGNILREPETRAFDELHPDLLVALAGLQPGGKDEAVEAVFRLSLLPDDEADLLTADPYERLDGYRRVRDLFQQGGAGGTPLERWVADRVETLEDRAQRLEEDARKTFQAAKDYYAKGDNTPAFNRLTDLKQPPLSYTKVVAENQAFIDDRLARILKEMEHRNLELLLPHARVNPVSVGDGTEIMLNLDSLPQGENFKEGLARFVEAPGATPVLTPGQGVNLRLRLLPARDGGPMPAGALLRDRPLVMVSPLDPAKERSIAFYLWTADPFFHAIDLDGVHVGIFSADPRRWPFPADLPALEGERRPPAFDFYGRGLGVVFRQGGASLGRAWEWNAWKEDNQGRRFVPPDRDKPSRKEQMHRRWFGFEPRAEPYRVRFVYVPESATVRLEVGGSEVHSETGGDWRPYAEGKPDSGKVRPSGLIQILSYTTCDIDDLVIRGRISERWREAALKEKERLAAPVQPEKNK